MRAVDPLLDKVVYEFDTFRVNAGERTLESSGRPVPISPKALDVLLVLLENRGRVVEKDELMRRVWPGTFVEENSLAFNISVLRKIFAGYNASSKYIETIPRRGYRFVAETVPASRVPSPPEIPAKKSSLRWQLAGALCALALIIALLGYLHSRRTPPGTTRLSNKDTIVLADFTNRTGDPIFDGTLRRGLAIELEQSPFLSLISESRVQQTLRLMRRSTQARLDLDLAREVCQRTGSALVVDGSISDIGSQYVLGLRASNCSSGVPVQNEQIQLARKEDVLGALSQMAHRFRSRVGESPGTLIKHDVPLAEATTGSLEALKAFTAAWKIHSSEGATNALPLFKRAVELDPQFAMAHASLGRIYADIDQADLAAESLRRAWQFQERASDREKFFITANYQLLVAGNLEEVRKTCEAWARTYPRDAVPRALLSGYINKFPGRYEEAALKASEAIDLDPDFGIAYYNLAVDNVYLNRLEQAESALRRAARRGLEIDEFVMLKYDLAFLRNDTAAMEYVAADARKRSGPQSWVSSTEARTLAYAGLLERARGMSQRAVAEAQQGGQGERASLWETGAAIREAFFGNTLEAKARATTALELSSDPEVEYGAAFALALTGDSIRSEKLADDLATRFPENTTIRFNYLPVLRAQLALNRHQGGEALKVLQAGAANEFGIPQSVAHGYFGALYAAWVRGETYLALCRYTEAAAEFRKILDHRGIVVSDPMGALARLEHARALALAGDKNNAILAYRDFLNLWKDADPSLPILRRAKAEFAKLQPTSSNQ